MMISQLAREIGARHTGADVSFQKISTDTRAIAPGDFFIALKGDNYDAHRFLDKAFEQGAIAAMVADPVAVDFPLLHVRDTRLGLGALAKCWLNQFPVKKVAITGSSGKTSVKEMVAAILTLQGPTLATKGNFNNDIGVPLTLCRVRHEHRFAVIEMGANHVGEIAYTSGLVEPDIALVNNVGSAHLEGFGSVDNIALAKSEIYSGLVAGGTAVVNLDDAYAGQFLEQTAHCKQVTFSRANAQATVHLISAEANNKGQYSFVAAVDRDEVSVELKLIGSHNVTNALAAIAICHELGCSHEVIAEGLASLKTIPGRLFPVEAIHSHVVIDDSYNANPDSVCSAIDVLSELNGKRCLVLGVMAELGQDAPRMHKQVGAYAAEKGIETVYGLGDLAAYYREGYLSNLPEQGAFVMGTSHQLLAQDLMERHSGETILIKGSRSSAMEKVIQKMKELNATSEGSN
ncbi:UDP-N-acetylmuramoyl-tripeptide--D-alanyl-D-alanine ligase [Ketobacter sp.]